MPIPVVLAAGGLLFANALLFAAIVVFSAATPAILGSIIVAAAQIAAVWVWQKHVSRTNLQFQKTISDNQILIGIMLDNDAESPGNWSFELDTKGKLSSVSPGFESATGVTAEIFQGLDFIAFLENLGAEPRAQIQSLKRRIETGQSFRNVDLKLPTATQSTHWRLSGGPLTNGNGNNAGFTGVYFDVSAARRTEAEIARMAHFDALTGLINRGQFNFQLEHLAGRLERYGSAFSLMMLDLDNFKAINDARGHLAGDAVLAATAQRINACIRETDMAARLGGDEFAVLFPTTANQQEIEVIADRITHAMRAPFDFDEEPLHVGISIGIVVAPLNGTQPEQLLRNVDLALYRAKHAGRNRFKFFEVEMDAEAREKRLLETELGEALHNRELELYFQPLVDATTGKTSSFEALVRWNHPIRGIVSPVEFIPIAEETGSMIEIGNWTINDACRVAKAWPEDLKVAVNLSAQHFGETDIVQVTKNALLAHDIVGERLEFEITEGVLLACEPQTLSQLTELQSLGVTITMDDFGTGYSSLSNLLKFAFDKIKIDKSFVDKIPDDCAAQRMLRAITSLGETLRISVAAEGVESREQADFLSDIACQTLQGYHFAKPLREIDLAGYLLNATAKEQWRPGQGNAENKRA